MLSFLVISQNKLFGAAIAQAVKKRYCLREDRITPLFYGDKSLETRRLEHFHELAEKIAKKLNDGDIVHDRCIGILDFTGPGGAKSADDIHALGDVRGMLILEFPEIQWIPVYKDGILWNSRKDPEYMTLDRAVELCKGGYSPLFDGDGLRSMLIERVHTGGYDPDNLRYSRTDAAFAIDEEQDFAMMNAYSAYRFGYRAFPISSKVCMENLLGKDKNVPVANGMTPLGDINVIAFEDVCLEFPDGDAVKFGKERLKEFPMLENAQYTVITTAAGEKENVSGNKTLKSYFSSQSIRKQVSALPGRWRKEFAIHWKRIFYNKFGGGWKGYYLVNIIEGAVVLLILLTAFFAYPTAFLPLLLIVFFIAGVWRQKIRTFLQEKLLAGTFIARSMYLRTQWVFMPKKYEGHCPIALSDKHYYWEAARKPLAGIFGLRNKCQLPNGRNYSLLFRSEDTEREYRNALKNYSLSSAPKKQSDGHSAPGVALEIATFLLRRAERMKGSIIDVQGAVHGAVLANVALELLNYKTPAVSIEALKWKHYYEIMAECSFVGVRTNIDMRDRYIDIHNAMGLICRAGDGSVRDTVFLSGMAELIDKISKLLRDDGKLEEASYFTSHSRRLHRKLMSPFVRSLLAYPEWVLRNKTNFAISFFGFSLVFFFYMWCVIDYDFLPALKEVFLVMIARRPPSEAGINVYITNLVRQIAGLHLGFVAAHFLMFMNRK